MVRDVFDPSVLNAWFPRSGPLLGVSRCRLVIAQASSLAAMAWCYFLAPQFAWAYAIVAVGGFLALAVPSATSGPLGIAGQRLMDASPGRRHLPGTPGYTLRLAVTLLLAFAVPAAVATALPSPVAARSTEPWVAIACLVTTAIAVVAAVGIAGPRRKGLVSFLVLATAVVILIAALALPGLPSPPGFPGGKAD